MSLYVYCVRKVHIKVLVNLMLSHHRYLLGNIMNLSTARVAKSKNSSKDNCSLKCFGFVT